MPRTRFDQLLAIWGVLLPHRKLVVLDATLRVRTGQEPETEYDATQLSDGERVILYLIGQALLIPSGTVLIVDEPELHVHRVLMAKLWDILETVRRDSAFVYITHDLEFAATRAGAQKIALANYSSRPEASWELQPIHDDAPLPDEMISRIAGSRQPVIFIEGDSGSLDSAIFRRVYPMHTVIPVGGCEAVIRAVASFEHNSRLHRIETCGIIDRDDTERAALSSARIYVLEVSEIENVLLIPSVYSAVAQTLGYDLNYADDLARQLTAIVIQRAQKGADQFALRSVKLRLDKIMKAKAFQSKTEIDLINEYQAGLLEIDIRELVLAARKELNDAVSSSDVMRVLALYDDKSILTEAARLVSMNRKGFEQYLGRILRADQGLSFLWALKAHLPIL